MSVAEDVPITQTSAEGPLRPQSYEDIKTLAKQRKQAVITLLALAPGNDPFYAGQPGRRKLAEWFATTWQRYGTSQVHLRRIHYILVSQSPQVVKPDGLPYENTSEDWELLGMASKAARCLGFVPADVLIDQRNPPAILPEDFAARVAPPTVELSGYGWWDWSLPMLPSLDTTFTLPLPTPDVYGYHSTPAVQPYHLEVWIEKSTMNDILTPICRSYGAVLQPVIGFASITRALDALKRVGRVEKPTRIFYISDYDPAGAGMAPAVARQVEYWIEQYAPGADIKLRPLVLTRAQVEQYQLPRIPIKATDRRKAHFEERYGEGAVELDALEALAPGVLGQIVRAALSPYYDRQISWALDERGQEAREQVEMEWEATTYGLRQEVEALTQDVEAVMAEFTADYDALRERVRAALAPYQDRLTAAREALDDLQQAFQPTLPPAPVSELRVPEGDDWLFASERDYLTQLEHYKGQPGSGQAGDGAAARP